MASRPSPATLVVKWVVVPAALVAIGYVWLGPYLGRGRKLPAAVLPLVAPIASRIGAQSSSPDTSVSSAPAGSAVNEPAVSFSVRPATQADAAPRVHRRRRRAKKKVPVEGSAPAENQTPDPASSPSGGESSPDGAGSGGAVTGSTTG